MEWNKLDREGGPALLLLYLDPMRHCELFRGLFFAKVISKKLNMGITTVNNSRIWLLTE
jgi:hypothetical protein